MIKQCAKCNGVDDGETQAVEVLVQCNECKLWVHPSCNDAVMRPGDSCLSCVTKRVIGSYTRFPEAQLPASESEGEGETIGDTDSTISEVDSDEGSLDGFIKHESEPDSISETSSENYEDSIMYIHVRGDDVFFGTHSQLKYCSDKKGPYERRMLPRRTRRAIAGAKSCVIECFLMEYRTAKRQREID